MLWDVNDGKHLYSLDAGGTINALSAPNSNLANLVIYVVSVKKLHFVT